MSGADLTWPGIDQERAQQACWHLQVAMIRIGGLHSLHLVKDPVLRADLRWKSTRAAGEHLRNANGYLGAVGFEKKARL